MAEYELALQGGLVTLTAWRGIGSHPVVPEGVQALGDDVFAGRGIRAVTLPAGLKSIGRRAFEKCARLEAIALPGSVERIGLEAFSGCGALRQVSLGRGMRVVEARAFWYCPSLREITLPPSLRLLTSRAFEGCSSLREVNILNPGAEMDEYVFSQTPYWDRLMAQAEKCTLGQLGATADCPTTLALPEGATHIDTWAYSKSRIRFARLPGSLRTVGMNAFRDCRELTEVSMSPNTCYTYTNRLEPGDGVFAGCSALERVTFCGPLKDFVWHDAEEPVLLRGFDREKTFLGCTRLRSMVAREVPLAAFPPQWRRYVLNGFLEDVQRECHCAPAVMEEYNLALDVERPRLVARAMGDPAFPLCQYLCARGGLDRESFGQVFRRAAEAGDPRTLSLLMDYQRHSLGAGTSALEVALEELADE